MADMDPHLQPDPDVAGYLLGILPDEEAARFASHLPGCAVCRAEIDELGDLGDLLAGSALEDAWPPDQPMPDGLEARTFDAIERAAAATGAEPTTAPSASPSATSPSTTVPSATSASNPPAAVVPIGSARSAQRRRAPWLIAAAVAAGVVIGVAVVPKLGGNQPAPLATVTLVAPDGGRAHGRAVIRATLTGLTIKLDATALEPSPPGTFYTCWLVGGGDTLAHQDRVSVGSFTVGASGTADVQWATGADLKRFGTIGVTLEPDNGDPLHQGPKVLETA